MGDKVGENPAALRAAVFLLSAKNRRGGGCSNTPSRAKVNGGVFDLFLLPAYILFFISTHDIYWNRKATTLGCKSFVRQETSSAPFKPGPDRTRQRPYWPVPTRKGPFQHVNTVCRRHLRKYFLRVVSYAQKYCLRCGRQTVFTCWNGPLRVGTGRYGRCRVGSGPGFR